ncbi:MAG: Arm DNA-binding domain-containing protein, partial [Pseudomonadota bacterium]
MPRATNKLTAPGVRAQLTPGRHSDGAGLYLAVDKSGAKRWVFLFRWRGGRMEMGLGGVGSVTLAKAREKATEAREALAAGRNPIEARRANSEIPTFGQMADEVTASKTAGFRRKKSAAIWRRALNDYAASM